MIPSAEPRLAGWSDVRAHVAATFGAAGDGADALTCAVALPRTAAEPAQVIAVGLRPIGGGDDAPWLKITCAIGSLRHLAPAALLASNATGTIGAYCTCDGVLALRQTLPLPGLRAADLDETIRALAQLAAAARARTRALEGP
jgi:hypothetical protein